MNDSIKSSAEVSFRIPADADRDILVDFIHESNDHLETSDLNLLTLETDPANRECLDAVFRAFHSIKGVAGFLGLEGVKVLAHEAENLLDQARTGKTVLSGPVMDCVFDTVSFFKRVIQDLKRVIGDDEDRDCQEQSRVLRDRMRRFLAGEVETLPAPPDPLAAEEDWLGAPAVSSGSKLGDLLTTSGDLSPEGLQAALRIQGEAGNSQKLGEVLVATGQADAKKVAQALRAQKNATPVLAGAGKETVKVDAERLDRLLDTIGELVIAESMILGAQELKGRISPRLAQQMGQLDKITRELQEMGTSLRMVPVRPTFQKMNRLVRDLSKQSGKAVNFVTLGEETELDKTVVEKIGDPLVHMIRNSLDHGIEPDSQERVRAGKPATATVKLSAFQKGGNVCIEITDDGRGLNREAILAKARERGLVREDEAPTDKEVFGFIFAAGFSTARQVTELSGRGVGMDVVKRNIESLRGRIEIQSQPGKGTTFSIWLPLTLAIIDGMVVRIGQERFVFPTLSIVRIVPFREEDRLTVKNKGEMLSLQGEMVPLFPLRGFFPAAGSSGRVSRLLVIAENEGRKAAFPVDELLGQQQIVIKKLEKAFPEMPGISGGAILPDGCVGLILDIDSLMKLGF